MFAAIALVVGGLIIRNTFTILLAQRTRELALLRCLGASRTQVRRSVLAEALAVGLVASLAGVLLGAGLAVLLRNALESIGAFRNLPNPALHVAPWIVVVSCGVGVVVTVWSSLAPARRATRIAPVTALRDAVVLPAVSRRRRLAGGAATVLAAATLAWAIAAESAGLVAVAAIMTLVALEVVGSVVANPMARAVGVPLTAVFGLPGKLARQNAMRNPRRTAASAMALTIGVALTAFLGIWADSQKTTDRQSFDASFDADFRLSVPGTGFSGAVSDELARRLEDVPELQRRDTVPCLQRRRRHGSRSGVARVPACRRRDRREPLRPRPGDRRHQFRKGRPRRLAGRRQRRCSADRVATPTTSPSSPSPTALCWTKSASSSGSAPARAAAPPRSVLHPTEFDRLGGPQHLGWIYGRVASGFTLDTAVAAIDRVVADYPSVELLDRDELRAQGDAGVDSGLRFFYGILCLLIVISLLGIVNTLALSIVERVREVGLLRAAGMERADVRSMIRVEAILIALIGVVVGLALGALFLWAMVSTAEPGSDLDLDISLPVTQLAALATFAVLAAVIAAIAPSFQASRIDVLRAIAAE